MVIKIIRGMRRSQSVHREDQEPGACVRARVCVSIIVCELRGVWAGRCWGRLSDQRQGTDFRLGGIEIDRDSARHHDVLLRMR